MKELTVKEKAKRYDEAIERAIKHRNNDGLTLEQYETIDIILPELAESEDEKIRRAIRGWIYTRPASFFDNGISKEKMLAWLEKRGERPTNEEMKELLRTEYEKGRADAIAEMQKPAEYEMPLLEKFKQAVYDCAWGKVTCKKEGETKEEYANRWAEHFLLMVRDWADDYIENREITITRRAYKKGKTDTLKKQNPAWSEEDENINHSIIDILTRQGFQTQVNWLKDRIQPQPQQEWSEEDEENLINSIKYLELFDAQGIHGNVITPCINWLKSLKERYIWKPSGEQIEALGRIVNFAHFDEAKNRDIVRILLDDLKKLKG